MSNLTGPKRNDAMLEQDRRLISKLLLEGYSNLEITDIINDGRPAHLQVSRQAIENDIKVLDERWKNSSLTDFNIWRNRILDELQKLKKTYWQEFNDSKRNKITTAIEALADKEGIDEIRGNGGLPGEMSMVQRVQTKEEMREGNAAYLQGVLAVIDKQCKILGIDAPDKLALTDPTGQHEANGAGEYLKSLFDKMSENKANPLQIPASTSGTEEENGN